MTAAKPTEKIGNSKHFWLYNPSTGYDLTHPAAPDAAPIYPRIPFTIEEDTVAVDPKKTAVVVIDLQNYFLSTALGRPRDAPGLKVVERLQKDVLPACRKAGIPVVWLGWGLEQSDIDDMPPTITRGFGRDTNFDGDRKLAGLGTDIGRVTLDDGSTVDGGKVLMQHQWNSEFYRPLIEAAEDSDISIYKNRLSGFWGGKAKVEEALEARGIKTLFFAGGNTDQCVLSSIVDAVAKSWDCFLLTDGTSTDSPEFAQQCVEFNMAGWGFKLSCKDFANGVANLQDAPH